MSRVNNRVDYGKSPFFLREERQDAEVESVE